MAAASPATVAGVIVGSVGLLAGGSLQAPGTGVVLRAITGLVLVAIGLQIAFGLRLLQPIERVGFRLWARVAPLARGLMARRGAGIVVIGLGLWTALAPIVMIVAGSGNGIH